MPPRLCPVFIGLRIGMYRLELEETEWTNRLKEGWRLDNPRYHILLIFLAPTPPVPLNVRTAASFPRSCRFEDNF